MTKEQTIVWNGQKPWEGVGHPIDNNMSIKEIMRKADLDWNVVRRETYYKEGNQEYRSARDVLFREGHPEHPFTEVPENWHVLQNSDAFEFFEKWVDEGKMRLLSTGSIKFGQIVWVLAEIGNGFELFKGDEHRNNILFTLPHKYGRSIDVRQTPLRISCNNMISFALKGKKDAVRWDHRRPFDPEHVRMTLAIADRQFFQLREYGQVLGNCAFAEDDLEEYLHQVYPVIYRPDTITNYKTMSKRAKLVMDNLDTQPGVEHAYGTWWQVFCAVLFCINHVFGNSNEQRIESAWYGKEGDQAVKALRLALEYASK